MSARTALIISCSEDEAQATRSRAELQRRTMSAYMLNIVMRNVQIDENLFEAHKRLSSWSARLDRAPGPRTTMLIRCSIDEAARIRAAAGRRDTTISGFVLHTLRCSWEVTEGLTLHRSRERELKIGVTVSAVLAGGSVITGMVHSIVRNAGVVQLEVEHDGDSIDRIYSWQVVRVFDLNDHTMR